MLVIKFWAELRGRAPNSGWLVMGSLDFAAWLPFESRGKYGMFQIWLRSLCNWESSSLQIDPFLLRSLKCALSLSASLKLRVTIKTNYISATASSSSFLSWSAFTCSGPTHPPLFLPHQPVTALCSSFFFLLTSPMHSQIHFHPGTWTKVCPHWLFTGPTCLGSHDNWARLTWRELSVPKGCPLSR